MNKTELNKNELKKQLEIGTSFQFWSGTKANVVINCDAWCFLRKIAVVFKLLA